MRAFLLMDLLAEMLLRIMTEKKRVEMNHNRVTFYFSKISIWPEFY